MGELDEALKIDQKAVADRQMGQWAELARAIRDHDFSQKRVGNLVGQEELGSVASQSLFPHNYLSVLFSQTKAKQNPQIHSSVLVTLRLSRTTHIRTYSQNTEKYRTQA